MRAIKPWKLLQRKIQHLYAVLSIKQIYQTQVSQLNLRSTEDILRFMTYRRGDYVIQMHEFHIYTGLKEHIIHKQNPVHSKR